MLNTFLLLLECCNTAENTKDYEIMSYQVRGLKSNALGSSSEEHERVRHILWESEHMFSVFLAYVEWC